MNSVKETEILKVLTEGKEHLSEREIIEKFEESIIRLNNPRLSYWFVKNINGSKAKTHIDIVLNSGDLTYCCYLVEQVPGVDVKRVEQMIIDSKDPKKCYRFAKNIEGANIKELQKIVVAYGNAEVCYDFAHDVAGAEIKSLQDKVVLKGKPELCLEFARRIKGATIKPLQDRVVESGDAKLCYEFAKYVKGAKLPSLQKVVRASKNVELCCDFARNIEGANVVSFEKVVKAYGSIYDLLRFAGIDGADVKMIQDAILAGDYYNVVELCYELVMTAHAGFDVEKMQEIIMRDYSYQESYTLKQITKTNRCLNFARNIEGADIKKLEDEVVKFGKPGEIADFARFVPGADKKRLENVLLAKAMYCNNKLSEYWDKDHVGVHDIMAACSDIAIYVEGADVQAIEKEIVLYCQKCEKVGLALYYAENAPSVNADAFEVVVTYALKKAISNRSWLEYKESEKAIESAANKCVEFALKVPNANVERIYDILVESNCSRSITTELRKLVKERKTNAEVNTSWVTKLTRRFDELMEGEE